ncbi:MAG: phytanoyl-CoA dioxygenase family protein, partial [Planctomycetales bacterium]
VACRLPPFSSDASGETHQANRSDKERGEPLLDDPFMGEPLLDDRRRLAGTSETELLRQRGPNMSRQHLFTPEQLQQYEEIGFVIQRGLFDAEEVEILRRVAKTDQSIEQEALQRDDGEGGVTQLRLWNEAGDDLYGTIARNERIVDPIEQVLGGEAYYYHSKMNFKEPRTGGAWAWHQDYGYWYDNGCLFPRMASCLIAVDPCTKENGCLQVLPGSHHLGRINHGKVGDQTGADPERVEEACKRLELVYCLMEPGDAVFFHCNLLHRSDQNKSAHPRWSYICCYNAARNNPYKESKHPRYTPLRKTSLAAIKDWGQANPTSESVSPS